LFARSFERLYRRACRNPNARHNWRPAEELPEVIGKALQIFIDICVIRILSPRPLMNLLRQRWVARTAFVFVDELVHAPLHALVLRSQLLKRVLHTGT
jgi:hypothetical protein